MITGRAKQTIKALLPSFVSMSPRRKRVVLLTVDALALLISVVIGRHILEIDCCTPAMSGEYMLVQGAFLVLGMAMLHVFGAHKTVLRHAKQQNIINTTWPVFLAGIFCAVLAICLNITAIGLGSLYISVLTACVLLLSSRMVAILMLTGRLFSRSDAQERIAIFGVGEPARQLAYALIESKTYLPVMFLDQSGNLTGRVLCGLPVREVSQLGLFQKSLSVTQVFFAASDLPAAEKRELIAGFVSLGLQVKVIPGLNELATGDFKIDDVREIQIEDLLGRDPVEPSAQLLDASIKGRNIMVTGAGGSIGSELCRQVLARNPRRLIAVEINEFALYRIEQELMALASAQNVTLELVPVLGSVGDSQLMKSTLSRYNVDTVYHAAAYKHVPMVEANVIPAVANNVFATERLLSEIAKSDVSMFVLISSDKAVRPTSIMGATKRLQEMIVDRALSSYRSLNYCMVRFGNVLGSSGSVVPLFREQIRGGGPVTVTHPEITRYFMTIPEAVQLVIQAGSMAKTGDTFILDMGEPIKIAKMAERMIELSGKTLRTTENSDGDIEILFTGLRPGEKMYEELVIDSEVQATAHPRIGCAKEIPVNPLLFTRRLQEIERAMSDGDEMTVRRIISELVDGSLMSAQAPVGTLPSLVVSTASRGSFLGENR